MSGLVTTLMVPEDKRRWPTLGPQVCDFIEDLLVFGPGDLRGKPAHLDDEKRALVYRFYEVYPRTNAQAGRRRFKRAALSLRKGSAKTELAAWIAAAELHPNGPVRTDGWRKAGGRWEPVGIGVSDPYIPMVAYTEEQTEELAYSALYVILSEGPLADDFDIGLDRIMRIRGDGKATALASAPDSRDGARTTFQHFDETGRFVLPRLREAHQTMLANIPKRRMADPWSLETTTSPVPGEGAVAEGTMDYARLVHAGKRKDSRLFFFHRQASDDHDLNTPEGVRAAVLEASGPTAEWSDIDGIVALHDDPQTDLAYWERVWLNRPVAAAGQAFDVNRWRELAKKRDVRAGVVVTLGFDGGRWSDSTGLVATEVLSGYQWVLGVWEKPDPGPRDWEVSADEVDETLTAAFAAFEVWRMHADPAKWEDTIAKWAARFGEERVLFWDTRRPKQMAYACRGYRTAITTGELTHAPDKAFESHVGNAQRHDLNLTDDSGDRLWTIRKERKDSPHKIDLAMAGILSWEARMEAIAAGAGEPKVSVYEKRGMRFLSSEPDEEDAWV